MCEKIINATDLISKNLIGAVSTNFHNKKLRYNMGYYILHSVLLVIVLLSIIATCLLLLC